MKQYKKWEVAFTEQVNCVTSSDNSLCNYNPASNIIIIDKIPFAIGPIVWIIMANNYSIDDYEKAATEYGVTKDGQWAALSDAHCSCFGWEAREENITYYSKLSELITCDHEAKVILEHKDILITVYPFLKKHYTKKALAI